MADHGLPPEEQQYLDKGVTHTCTALLALLLFGMICVEFRTGWRALGAALLWLLASYGVGLIVGFLFAIPRPGQNNQTPTARSAKPSSDTDSDPEPGENDCPHPGLGVNTNLVEISDWLTKMIVGIGLVELKGIPGYISRIGVYVGHSLGQPNMDSTGASLVVYFVCLGSLTSYLLTRLFFGPLFQMADHATQSGIALAKRAFEEAELNGYIADALQILPQANAADAKYPRWRYDKLIQTLSSYRRRLPLSRRLHIVLARLYRYRDQDYATAIKVLDEFVKNKRKAGQEDTDVSDALFNIACYYSRLMEITTEVTTRAKFEKQAAQAMRESIRIRRENFDFFNSDEDLDSLKRSESGKAIEREFGSGEDQNAGS